MIRKIGGWYRIGIVLSIIWVLVVSGIAIYECFRNRAPGHLIDDIGILSVFGTTISQAFVDVAAMDLFRHERISNIPIKEKPNTGKVNPFDIAEEELKRQQTQPRKRDIFDIVGEGYDRKHAAKEKIPNYKITFKIKNFLCVLFLPILGMWGLVLGIVRKENKTSTKIPSKSKRILSIIKMGFKNIRVGIILILVGTFIPTVLYPLTKPTSLYFAIFDLYASKGAKYDCRLSDLEVVLKERTSAYTNRTAIPYKYLVAGGIVLVFTGISILVFAVKKTDSIGKL